jgi:hypothetical protein
MSREIRVYSEKDIKKIVDKKVNAKLHAYDLLINSLKNKVNDLDKIVALKFNRVERRLKYEK